jgi:hypothetical protein
MNQLRCAFTFGFFENILFVFFDRAGTFVKE